MPGRVFIRSAFQIAEDHRHPVSLRYLVKLDGEDFLPIIPSRGTRASGVLTSSSLFGFPPAPRGQLRADRDPACDPVQPRADRVVNPERPPFDRQYQEGRLKSIFGFVLIATDPAAHCQHHRAVPFNER